jgi:hypothetical protein
MTEAQKLYKELIEKMDAINKLQEEANHIKVKIADIITPYKVGEKTDVKGYSHKGKPCIIDKYTFGLRWLGHNLKYEPNLEVKGRIVKKDGQISTQTVDWGYYGTDEKIENALKQIIEKQG